MNEKPPVVLIVDDKRNMLRLMAKVLQHDALVRTAEDGAGALRVLTDEAVDVVLCDLRLPDMDGLDVLNACKRLRPNAEFILMTAYATVATAIEALKLGAYDYLTKPFEPEAARAVVLRALSRVAFSQPAEQSELVLPGVLACSPAMKDLAGLVRRIAESDATTLIVGETGTGKERIARAIHEFSLRRSGQFVALNCAALPADLLESELFGHAMGAFTGAVRARKGLFEQSAGGSLFLDEIGEMRLSLQAKLTRALEERAIRRLGEVQERSVDVRLIAATHRDIEAMVASGMFRQDLWYRLNVALVRVPPLRERREDIGILAHHFLRQHAERARSRLCRGFSGEALERLTTYDWPGNVRQLRSAVERASVVSTSAEIGVMDLPPELLRSDMPDTDAQALSMLTWSQALERGRSDMARRYLEAVLRRFEGQVAEAAAHAGIERESFYRLLRKHGVSASDFREG